MKVHIIFKEGPEWSNAVEGWLKPQPANRRVKQLEDERKAFLAERAGRREKGEQVPHSIAELEDSVSHYVVKPIELKDAA